MSQRVDICGAKIQNPALGYETFCTCAAAAKCTLILSFVLFAPFPSI